MNHVFVEPTPAELAAEVVTPARDLHFNELRHGWSAPHKVRFQAFQIYSTALRYDHNFVIEVGSKGRASDSPMIKLLRDIGVLSSQIFHLNQCFCKEPEKNIIPINPPWLPNSYDRNPERLLSRLDAALFASLPKDHQ